MSDPHRWIRLEPYHDIDDTRMSWTLVIHLPDVTEWSISNSLGDAHIEIEIADDQVEDLRRAAADAE